MIKTTYQTPELRDANDNVVQQGAFGKNTALSNATNDGWIDFVMNDLEALHDVVGDTSPTLDGNGHVVEPANLAIGDEDGNRLKTSYLKLTGGTLSGALNIAQNLKMQDNQENVFGGFYVPASSASSQYLVMYGGSNPSNDFGGTLRLYPSGNGKFQLTARKEDGSASYTLTCTDAGALTWRGNVLAYNASPALTGNPTAPTQETSNNSTRLATTAFVTNDLKAHTLLTSNAFASIIQSNDDLNDYKTAGTYYSGGSTTSSTLSNTPVTSSGFKLIVCATTSAAYCVQIIIQYQEQIYIRGYNNGTWRAWKRIANREDVLALSGGTMTGDLILTGSRYIWKYSGTMGTNPTSSLDTYVIRMYDSENNTIGGLYKNISTNGNSAIRLYNPKWADGTILGVSLSYYSGGTRAWHPMTDNAVSCGTASYRWAELYAGTATINTSDERLKSNITAIPDEVLDAWGEVNWYQYQFNDSIAEKGETRARIHTGAIAQRIESVFTTHGLDANRYGLLCYDEWQAQPAERDDDGNIVEEARPAGNRYSLRYEEALCMEAAYQRRRADRLEARIAALEARLS